MDCPLISYNSSYNCYGHALRFSILYFQGSRYSYNFFLLYVTNNKKTAKNVAIFYFLHATCFEEKSRDHHFHLV